MAFVGSFKELYMEIFNSKKSAIESGAQGEIGIGHPFIHSVCTILGDNLQYKYTYIQQPDVTLPRQEAVKVILCLEVSADEELVNIADKMRKRLLG